MFVIREMSSLSFVEDIPIPGKANLCPKCCVTAKDKSTEERKRILEVLWVPLELHEFSAQFSIPQDTAKPTGLSLVLGWQWPLHFWFRTTQIWLLCSVGKAGLMPAACSRHVPVNIAQLRNKYIAQPGSRGSWLWTSGAPAFIFCIFLCGFGLVIHFLPILIAHL